MYIFIYMYMEILIFAVFHRRRRRRRRHKCIAVLGVRIPVRTIESLIKRGKAISWLAVDQRLTLSLIIIP